MALRLTNNHNPYGCWRLPLSKRNAEGGPLRAYNHVTVEAPSPAFGNTTGNGKRKTRHAARFCWRLPGCYAVKKSLQLKYEHNVSGSFCVRRRL